MIHLGLWLTTTSVAVVCCLEVLGPWLRRYICAGATHGLDDDGGLSRDQRTKASMDWRRNGRRRGVRLRSLGRRSIIGSSVVEVEEPRRHGVGV